MNAIGRRVCGIFIVVVILLMPACNIPVNPTDAPLDVPTSLPATQIPNTITDTLSAPVSPPITTENKTPTPSTTLTATPTFTPTFTPTNSPTPTPTITLTPKPPMPDFDPIVTFGSGGGGGFCTGPDAIPNDAYIKQAGRAIWLCLYLRGINFGQPFKISLMQLGGDGTIILSPDIKLDQENQTLKWTGYQNSIGSASWTSDGTLNLYDVGVWWSQYFSAGQWRLSVVQANSTVGGFSKDFQVKEEYKEHIDAVGSNSKFEVVPNYSSFAHPLKLKENGRANFVGRGFPANRTIYVLLYEKPLSQENLNLVDKLSVDSKSDGSVASELPTNLQVGKTYLLVGVSDPNARIGSGEMNLLNDNLPHDYFVVESSVSTSVNSCPGAPSQRMVINQRGYVCTKEDAVKLRNAPNRSGSEMMQLAPGASFTVVGGPSCADNWSWWNVRLDNGTTGWFSEGGDQTDPYFICPLK